MIVRPRGTALTMAGLALLVAAIYLLRIDSVAGLILDDAWYMVLGKSLADGEGLRLISSSAPPIVPAVPPGFPALLAIVFAIDPAYPSNLVWLKAVSVLAMFGVGITSWIYFTRYRDMPPAIAFMAAAAIVLTPAMVFLATSTVMAECVFMLAQLATVVAIERATRRERNSATLSAGVMAGVTILVRTAGVAVAGAGLVYFLLQRRWRQAGLFAAATAITVTPWLIYASVNAPTFDERLRHGGSIAYTYQQLLSMERPGAVNTEASSDAILNRAVRNLGDIVSRDIGAVFLPVLYRPPLESGQEAISVGRPGRGSMGGPTGTRVVSVLIFLALLAGIFRARAWLSLPVLVIAASLVVIGPVESQTFRYLVPLSPLLFLLLWQAAPRPDVMRVVLLCVLVLHLVDHAQYLRARSAGEADWVAGAQEIDVVIDWVDKNLPADAPIVSSNPGLLYLQTGRKGLVYAFPTQNWERWRQEGIRYVVATRRTELPLRRFNAKVLFQTKGQLWVVEM